MVMNPARPEIASVTSEALQLKIRQLLPSQDGFGADLAAQNVIVPVIDLTASAEGSDVREDLQTALAYGSQTAFNVSNGSTDIANSPGFYRVVAGVGMHSASAVDVSASITMTDGVTPKTVWKLEADDGADYGLNANIDYIFFLDVDITLTIVSSGVNSVFSGSIRQIADVNGTLVQPSGFNPQ